MKLSHCFLLLAVTFLTGFRGTERVEDIEFVCMKTHKASNTCHFNFRVDGANYRYLDVGCRFQKRPQELVRKVEEGELFLAKDWKVACPEAKQEITKDTGNDSQQGM